MEDEQLWESARDVLADDANPLGQFTAAFARSFRIGLILSAGQPLSLLLFFTIRWLLLKDSELFCELQVKLWRDVVIVGDELRPNVVPKHCGNPISQQRLVLGFPEIGLQLFPEDALKALPLPDVEHGSLLANLSDLLVILLLLMHDI